MEQEIWKAVPGYEGLYEASNLGRVKSIDRIVVYSNGKEKNLLGKILKLDILSNGYRRVSLCKKNKITRFLLHRLLLLVFRNFKDDFVVNHINHDKSDNNISNLEIINSRENNTHSRKNKTSQYVGVCFKKDKYRKKNWYSSIKIESSIIFLGYYYTEKEAHEAYLSALKEHGLQNKYATKNQD